MARRSRGGHRAAPAERWRAAAVAGGKGAAPGCAPSAAPPALRRSRCARDPRTSVASRTWSASGGVSSPAHLAITWLHTPNDEEIRRHRPVKEARGPDGTQRAHGFLCRNTRRMPCKIRAHLTAISILFDRGSGGVDRLQAGAGARSDHRAGAIDFDVARRADPLPAQPRRSTGSLMHRPVKEMRQTPGCALEPCDRLAAGRAVELPPPV